MFLFFFSSLFSGGSKGGYEDESSPPVKQCKYYPDPKKSILSFPLIYEVQGLFEDEWARPDKKLNVHKRTSKLQYIFFGKRLPTCGTLYLRWTPPCKGWPVRLLFCWKIQYRLRSPRTIDQNLFCDGSSLQATIALTSIATALGVWVVDLESWSSGEVGEDDGSSPLLMGVSPPSPLKWEQG